MVRLFSSGDTETSSQTATILVIDDDPAIVAMLREDLSSEGYQVLCGYDGQMAIRLARQKQPDLIIMDVAMPMTSGVKAFEILRDHAGTAAIPVIFITGELSKDVYPVIASAPRVAHVKKPMELENLNSLVREFLERYPTTR
jgi:two-component system cell cycle response regulator